MPTDINTENLNKLGKVESVSNSICTISGLRTVGLNNLLEFSSGEKGLVFSFNKDSVQALVLGDYHNLRKGDLVKIIDDSFKVKISSKLLGRIIDPMGKPLDGRGEIEAELERYFDSPIKRVNERKHITKPLSTGFLIIDSQIPIGMGQRELLIGEQKVKKSDTAIAVICNQAKINPDVISIYVTIDAETTAVKRKIQRLVESGAINNTITIVSRSSDPASLNYLAPMVGVTIAEAFASTGKDVLLVLDNLTRHAKIYRQISLLLNRPPGREAYPGDMFYLHARLLERCGCFNDTVGGGSITALPLVETQGEEITDYITTNLMSITDGHILFRQAIANKGIKPAIDSGFSVSRIGGRAQIQVLKDYSDILQAQLINYREVIKFMLFGSELQEDTLLAIELGKRIDQLLNQEYTELLSPQEELAILYLITSKTVLKWQVEEMLPLRKQLIKFLSGDNQKQWLDKALKSKNKEEAEPYLSQIITYFVQQPDTIKMIVKVEASPAEKETIIDLLNKNEGENANAGSVKKTT